MQHAKLARAISFSALAILLVVVLLVPTTVVHAATITVCYPSGCAHTTIQAAINASTAGDVILVSAGTYVEQISLNKDVTIEGANAAIPAGATPGVRVPETIIDGGFYVTASGAKIDGVTIQNGFVSGSVNVGVAVAASNITVEDTIIENVSSPAQSDGLSTQPGNNYLALTNSTIQNNWRGIYLNPGNGHTLTGNLINANNGVGVGIGSDGQSNLTLTGNTISNHTLEGWGSSSVGANVVASGNSFTGNGVSVAHYGGSQIDASDNWWGADPPSGSAVSGDVDNIPWCTDATCTTFAAPPVHNVTQDTYFSVIQLAITAANPGDVINAAAGTYNEDVNINKPLTLQGAGPDNSTIIGPIGGDGATVRVAANNVTVTGFTITRDGNNTTDWNDLGLNYAGVAVQGQAITGMNIHDNKLTGNRTAIDVNNSNGHTIRNNVITGNHTGLIFRNQTDNITFTENDVTNNRTVGLLFLDASSGTNAPVQTALNGDFSNNNFSGNWYGQIVDRQTGGSLPLPGTTNLKNFSGNWLGTVTPVVTTANSAEPGYAVLIPVEYGGTATPPGGQPDIAGAASANIDYTPYLNSGTDTDVETTPGYGIYGFQGDFSNLWVTADGAQTGATGRIQEGINSVSGSTVNVVAGTYVGAVNIPTSVTLKGAQYGVAVGGRTAFDASESTIQGLVTVDASDVVIDGFTLTNPNQTYAVSVDNTPAHSDITISYNIVDTVGAVGHGANVHSIIVSDGADSVTIAHNGFNNIKAGAKSANGIGILQSPSDDPSTGLVIEDNTFTDIASVSKGAYGVIINNGAGTGDCTPNIPGGGAPGVQIKDNTFSGLSGGWTHAIGLEGPTPGAVVSGNEFSGLTAAGADNAAIFFQKNADGNTVTIFHNKFNGSGFFGVAIHPDSLPGGCSGYNYTVTSEDNYWGAVSGPGPLGVGAGTNVGPNVDYEPWCNADFSICGYTAATMTPTTGDDLFCVGQTTVVNLDIAAVANLYGYQFEVTYDAAKASAVGAFVNTLFDTQPPAYIPGGWNAACTAGVCKFSVSHTSQTAQQAVTGTGTLAKITFTGVAPGTFPVTIGSNATFNDIDGELLARTVTGPLPMTVCGNATISGKITMQGRASGNVNSGTVSMIEQGSPLNFTPVIPVNFSAVDGTYSISVQYMPGGTSYKIVAEHGLYLDNEDTILVTGNLANKNTRLWGGDANNDGGVHIGDLSCIGGSFGGPVAGSCAGGSSDINADGVINVQDLSIAGGNFDKVSPQPW